MNLVKKLIDTLNHQFVRLNDRSREILVVIPEDKLFEKSNMIFKDTSCGYSILRSAGKVEQTFGGITARLWDDPFEWTLPEELSTTHKILEYLNEVETTRKRGFSFFSSDEDLSKELPAPEKMKTVFELLLETLIVAVRHQEVANVIQEEFIEIKKESEIVRNQNLI